MSSPKSDNIQQYWGKLDLTWTLVFIIIIGFLIYWSYLIWTDNRPYINTANSFDKNKDLNVELEEDIIKDYNSDRDSISDSDSDSDSISDSDSDSD